MTNQYLLTTLYALDRRCQNLQTRWTASWIQMEWPSVHFRAWKDISRFPFQISQPTKNSCWTTTDGTDENNNIYAMEMDKSGSKTADYTPLDMFRTRCEPAKDYSKRKLFHFVDCLLTTLVHKKVSDEVHDRSIRKRSQSFVFIGMFPAGALFYPFFIHTVESYLSEKSKSIFAALTLPSKYAHMQI